MYSTVKQTSCSWALSVRKAVPWRHSLFQIFRNCMHFCLAFISETPVRRFQNIWMSIWRQLQIYIDENPKPKPHHAVLERSPTPTWSLTQQRDLYQVLGRNNAGLEFDEGFWKTHRLATGLCTMPHKYENPGLTVRKDFFHFLKKTNKQIHSYTTSNMDDFKTICKYKNLSISSHFSKDFSDLLKSNSFKHPSTCQTRT